MKEPKVARLTILFSLLLFLVPSHHSLAQQEEYAKWGEIAVEKVKENIPIKSWWNTLMKVKFIFQINECNITFL